MLPELLSASVGWVQQTVAAKTESLLLNIVSAGPIPNHVAFIMDGNRRYARRNRKEVKVGHAEGYVALRRILAVCMKLKVRCVSVYAFSIENFKRSPSEVDDLLGLVEEKLNELCQHGELLQQYGVRLNVVGNKSLFPERLQLAARRAEELTCKHDRAILNICMPYTSRDEIATAVRTTVQERLEDDDSEPITERDIEEHLMTSLVGSPPLDILVRTSGVRRLSDYLIWQACENTQLQFTDVYWPEFSFWDFLPIILDYQRKCWSSSARNDHCMTSDDDPVCSE
ncbi:Di-trans-poly-cis-decaprenylcistransferase [Panus rudis PR-1116 ss-1]|nr:Di-trans-poly-cis-decaprenylcistransferase [Panus rudis PR-1116 ss-1]